MNDFLTFRRMLTPIVIQLIFWIGAGTTVIYGILWASSEDDAVAMTAPLALIVGGPLIVRLACESMIVLFRINETLSEIARTDRH